MGAGNSKEDIVSMALVYIGESPIASFTEGTSGLVASNLYENTRDDLLTSHRWRFAVGKKSLSRLTSTPLNEWTYAFQLPTDLLMLFRVYPFDSYEVYEDKIYSHSATCDIDYLFRPSAGAFPAYFVKALAYKLAAEFAMGITNNQSLAKIMDDRAIRHLAAAKHKDTQGRPTHAITHRPWIQVRN